MTFLLVHTFSNAQVKEELREKINDAEYFYWNGDYSEALVLYKEILKVDPENANMNYKAGRCYQCMPFEAGRSINYLKKAVGNASPLFIQGSHRERKAPLDALYFLAEAYHQNRYYDEALVFYEQFKDSLKVEDVNEIALVDRQLLSSKTAKEISKNPVSVEIWNVGNIVNTVGPDLNPCVTADGKTIFFNRIIAIESDDEQATEQTIRVYTSDRIDEEQWTKPLDITDQLGTKGGCMLSSVNADGTILVLSKSIDYTGGISEVKGGALYYSQKEFRTDQVWPEIQLFDKTINTRYNESHGTISPDGKNLYFTSDRKGGYGAFDIYVSEKQEDGSWGDPINLGPTINTEHNEETPFILEDNKTLYFASEGHYNMGGYDIFTSKKNKRGVWSEPINMGVPINNPDDNLFFAPALSGRQAYYAQARHEGYFTFGDQDIYEINMLDYDQYAKGVNAVVKGTVSFDDNKVLDVSAKVFVYNGAKLIDTLIIDEEGKYRAELPVGEYKLKFVRKGYGDVEKNVVVEKSLAEKFLTINALMYPIHVESKKYYTIRNIYFDNNSSELNREALIEVEKLKTIMIENPSLYIEVVGHTDSRASAKVNKVLSEQRSRAVIDYLVNNKIEKTRFVSIASGEDKTLIPDVTTDGTLIDAAAKLNRRVEIRILKTNENVEIVVDNTPIEEVLSKFDRYSVQLMKTDKAVNMAEFKVLGDSIKVFEAIIKPSTYIYYFGDFLQKGDAVSSVDFAISKKFTKATIINYFELNQDSEFIISNPVPFKKKFTIQLQAVSKEQIITTKRILAETAKYKTEDGFYRYTYKEYSSVKEAGEDLFKIWDAGFPNAFIVAVKDLRE